MKHIRGHDGDGSEHADAPELNPASRADDGSEAEEKRLRARRRILKGGVGGMTAVILSVYQRPSGANHDDDDDDDDKDQSDSASVVCQLQGGEQRKVGMSICLSVGKVT